MWMFTTAKGLREIRQEPNMCAVGTLVSNDGKYWQMLKLQTHKAESQKYWHHVKKDDLPARLRTEALLLGVGI